MNREMETRIFEYLFDSSHDNKYNWDQQGDRYFKYLGDFLDSNGNIKNEQGFSKYYDMGIRDWKDTTYPDYTYKEGQGSSENLKFLKKIMGRK